MSNLIQLLKDNFKTIIISILVYQIFLTIFCFTTANLVILAVLIIIIAGYVIFTTYKDDIIGFFKR